MLRHDARKREGNSHLASHPFERRDQLITGRVCVCNDLHPQTSHHMADDHNAFTGKMDERERTGETRVQIAQGRCHFTNLLADLAALFS